MRGHLATFWRDWFRFVIAERGKFPGIPTGLCVTVYMDTPWSCNMGNREYFTSWTFLSGTFPGVIVTCESFTDVQNMIYRSLLIQLNQSVRNQAVILFPVYSREAYVMMKISSNMQKTLHGILMKYGYGTLYAADKPVTSHRCSFLSSDILRFHRDRNIPCAPGWHSGPALQCLFTGPFMDVS